MMLDEMDKMGAGIHGDPSAALLEVLDPEQNNDIPGQLPRRAVRSLAGAVHRHRQCAGQPFPAPLRDRMEIIAMPGYIEDREAGDRKALSGQTSTRSRRAERRAMRNYRRGRMRAIIRDYTREAGVRNLEREIGAICRHAAMRIAEGTRTAVVIRWRTLQAILGGDVSRMKSPCAPVCRVLRRAWPGPRSAEISCSLRRRSIPVEASSSLPASWAR